MVTDEQVRRLRKLSNTEKNQEIAASKAGMDPTTARRYLGLGRLPSEMKQDRRWRTREDPFNEVWSAVQQQVQESPGLEAKTLFEWLQREYPGRFSDGQIRTLQRRIKQWRVTEGPAQEVYFGQVHVPGRLCASDFTHMTGLEITLDRQTFAHLVYHFVLTYSNWETGTICYSESLESLSEGWQNAVWELGAVTVEHRTDSLTSAVNNMSHPEEFNRRYEGLMKYYGVKPRHTNPASPNENGDVEQSHHRFKRAVEQALLLRGSRDFGGLAARAVSQGTNRTAECGPAGAAGRRVGGDEGTAGAADGNGQAGAGDGGFRQSDPRGAERLLGEQPADRRAGGSAAVPGPCRGLARAAQGGTPAAAAWAEQASRRLPAHHRLAGAEAWRV